MSRFLQWTLPFRFLTKIMHAFLISPCELHAQPIPFYLMLLLRYHFTKRINNETPHYVMLFQLPISSSVLRSNILFSALFTNILDLCFSPRARGQMLYSCKGAHKIIHFYVLVLYIPFVSN
jgi:hypothetical protein